VKSSSQNKETGEIFALRRDQAFFGTAPNEMNDPKTDRLRHRDANPGARDEQAQKAGSNQGIPREILLLHDDSDQK
jgi:hypothetical protein